MRDFISMDFVIDVVSCAGVITTSLALIYVIIRLEQEIRRWGKLLEAANERFSRQEQHLALNDAVARAWAHIEALEKGLPPPGSKPDARDATRET